MQNIEVNKIWDWSDERHYPEKIHQANSTRQITSDKERREQERQKRRLRGVILERRSPSGTVEHDEDWVTLGSRPGTIVRGSGSKDNPPLRAPKGSSQILVIAVQGGEDGATTFHAGEEVSIEPIARHPLSRQYEIDSQKENSQSNAPSVPPTDNFWPHIDERI